MKVWIVTRDGRPHEVFNSEKKALDYCTLQNHQDVGEHNGAHHHLFAVYEREVR